MNLLYWLVGGAAFCLLAGWWLLRYVKRSQAALRQDRERLELEREQDARRAVREAAEREAARQRISAQQAARADARRRVESDSAAEKPAVTAGLPPVIAPKMPVPRVLTPPEPAARAADPAPPMPQRLPPPPVVAPPAAELPVVPPVAPAVVAPPPRDPPVVPAPLAAPATPVALTAATADAEHPLVMVADDSKVVRVKTGRILAQHPYRVCFASDGLEAFGMIQAEPPSLLITDVDMPGLDGFELTRRLRADPATARLPVIMITAADATHRAAAHEAGVDVVLGKPFSEEDLLGHVQAAVRRRALEARPSAPAQRLTQQAFET